MAWGNKKSAETNYEDTINNIYESLASMYSEGGSYGAGTEAMLERQKTKDVASATQGLISSGLYGTTTTSGLSKKWEEEIGVPSRLKLEDMRTDKYTGVMSQYAQYLQNIYQQLANLTAQSGGKSTSRTINAYSGFKTL